MIERIIQKKILWEGKELVIETGRMANQASGSVLVTYGNTQVLATVVVDKKSNPELDFIPLSVHYQEKYYAIGKIPGGFFKRESKPSEREVLISRLIDRPIRPTINENFKNEIQIIAMVLAYDKEVDTDITAIIASSAALAISGTPITDIVAAARVSVLNDKLVVNPLNSDINAQENKLDLVVAGTRDGILMVESEAKELSEELMLEALDKGFNSFQAVIELIADLQKEVNKPELPVVEMGETHKQIVSAVDAAARTNLTNAFKISSKQERVKAITDAKDQALATIKDKFSESDLNVYFSSVFTNLEKNIVRTMILKDKIRIDGRGLSDIRNITSEVDVIKQAHGSALFTRGETQALAVTTLGSEEDEQIVDDITREGRDRFLLHYNFLPFSVGEVGRVGAPGRREVGHGKLAFRALNPLIPNEQEFPYSMRVVSEILGSNGSSSMATVCGSCLSLMAAGVPIKALVAGIAMGLIKESNDYAVLSDILGDEDHLGDMDFKVAGTKDGITALQMDLKITSINKEIMTKALAEAKNGRMHILGEMSKTLSAPRSEVSDNSPKTRILVIDKDKIPEVIGSGGKVIKGIINTYGVKISVKDTGLVRIYGTNKVNVDNACEEIRSIVIEPEVGQTYSGKVVKVLEFGAFINFMGSKDGFLHVSEITDKRNVDVNDYVKVGDIIKVKVVKIDNTGKIRLSTKGTD
ncbi:polyribonucleotide nucleotidyltransferase [Rickettsiales bacterium LUAb2]